MRIALPAVLALATLGAPTAFAKPPERDAAYAIDAQASVWSQSSWKRQKLRDGPDRLAGAYTLLPSDLK